MSKDRKVRNFDFLKQTPPELPSREEVIQKTNAITSKTIVISGWWYNEIMVTMIPRNKNKPVIFVPYINEEEIKNYISEGYLINYLPEQNIYNDQMFKMNITDKYSRKF